MADYNNEFAQLYKELESWAKNKYEKMKDMKYLENNFSLSDYKHRLQYFREVRNLMTHNGKIGHTEAFKMLRVTKSMLNEFERLKNDIQEPALKKAVPIEEIFSKGLDDEVLEASRYMKRKKYTHIPIVEDGRVVGLFGEKALFDLVCSGKAITEKTTFRDLWKFIDIEKIEICKFIGKDTIVPECKNKFSYAIKKGKRLDIVFITKDGTSNGQLLGLTTIWDMPGIEYDEVKTEESHSNN